MRTEGKAALLAVAVLAVGGIGFGAASCGSSTNDNNADAGTTTTPPDAGNAPDAGIAPDAGVSEDAGTPDAGTGNECAADFAGCTQFTDLTADNADRTVNFGGALGNNYVPKCIKVKVNQPVTFNGDFTFHPLAPACGPAIPVITVPLNNSATITFTAAGVYGYFCTTHGTAAGTGMAGSVQVVEQ